MSARRLRALKAEFVKKHGRVPEEAKLIGYAGGRDAVFDPQDEMRGVKKDYLRARRGRP